MDKALLRHSKPQNPQKIRLRVTLVFLYPALLARNEAVFSEEAVKTWKNRLILQLYGTDNGPQVNTEEYWNAFLIGAQQ